VFIVQGSLADLPYTVAVADDGTVTGSRAIEALLDESAGTGVMASPTGPAYVLDRGDPTTVLAALMDLTDVTATTGDVPRVLPVPVLGAVY
jgi:hypothetical protein